MENDMKIKRIISVLALIMLVFSLCSCDQLHFHSGGDQNQGGATPPTSSNNGNVEPEEETDIIYVYSVVSKVIHIQGCYHIDRINEEYIAQHIGDISAMLENGYTVCKDCMLPDEEKEDQDVVVPDPDSVAKEDATYLLNKSSMVVHLLDCHNIKSMSDKNKKYTDKSLEELIDDEYRPCGSCMPDEAEAWEKAHPEAKK